eukprot:Hpha_TRINITY_DN4698_c0_g1::TRINITY_DN4698_c0_g1_i1::g.97180::m.97180
MSFVQVFLPRYLQVSFSALASTVTYRCLYLRVSPFVYLGYAWRYMGSDMVVLVNGLIAGIVGGVTTSLPDMSRWEAESLANTLVFSALIKLLVVVFIMNPVTDDELVLWTVWYAFTLAVQCRTEVGKVKVEAMRQVLGTGEIYKNWELHTFTNLNWLLALLQLLVGVVYFEDAGFINMALVCHDSFVTFFAAVHASARLLVLRTAEGHYCRGQSLPPILFDADEWLAWVDAIADLPLAMIALLYPVWMLSLTGGFSVLAFILLKSAAGDFLAKLRRLQTTNFAAVFSVASPRELLGYGDPCAVCYDHLCLDVSASEMHRLAVEDAATAAAAAVAVLASGEMWSGDSPTMPFHSPESTDGAEEGDEGSGPSGRADSPLDSVASGDTASRRSRASSPGLPRRLGEGLNHLLLQRPGERGIVSRSLLPRVLPCGHIFHHRCLCRWLEEKRECPICKQAVGTGVQPPQPARESPQRQQRQPARTAAGRLLRALLPARMQLEVHAVAHTRRGSRGAVPGEPSETVRQVQAVLPQLSRETIDSALQLTGGDPNLAVLYLLTPNAPQAPAG